MQLFWRLFRAVILIGICFVVLYPMFLKLFMSFMNERDLLDVTVNYFPKNYTIRNYLLAIKGLDYQTAFFNTFFLSAMVSILQIFSTSLVAYGFARFDFPFKKLAFALVLATLIIPPRMIMIPLYMRFQYFDIFGLFTALFGAPIRLSGSFLPYALLSGTCVGIKNGLYIYLLRQQFRGLPKELEEAALIDGLGYFKTFRKIVLPCAMPMLITIFLFSFVWQWTETFYANMFLGNQVPLLATQLSALSVNIKAQYFSSGLGNMDSITSGYQSIINNTGTILVILPLLVMYLFFQRHFVEGVERSGIVG